MSKFLVKKLVSAGIAFSTAIGNGFTPVVVLRTSVKPQTMDAGESRVSAGIGGLRNEVRPAVDAFFVRACKLYFKSSHSHKGESKAQSALIDSRLTS